MPTAILISASSDIGYAIGQKWKAQGWNIYGTYRTQSNATDKMQNLGIELFNCDLRDIGSIQGACAQLRKYCPLWDVLVLCPGVIDPVGRFSEGNYDEWERSIQVNFTSQLRITHELLPTRNVDFKNGPCVLYFAGGGTNNATVNYSAYTISKIALIKMCELLDAEIQDTRFSILGPGWVKTKIHESTLLAKERAGSNYQRTIDKLAGNECTPMEDVLNCCDWLISSSRGIISGRNFSVVYDQWRDDESLTLKLQKDPNMFKLRRMDSKD